MRAINWGPTHSITELFTGCSVLDCANHGGVIVNRETLQTHAYFEKLKMLDLTKFELESGDYAFEQDCDSSIVLALIPRDILKSHYDYCSTPSGYEQFLNNCQDIIKSFNPEIYTAIFE